MTKANDWEWVPHHDMQLTETLLELAREGRLNESTGSKACADFFDRALPPAECNDLETWKRVAREMAGAVARQSRFAACAMANNQADGVPRLDKLKPETLERMDYFLTTKAALPLVVEVLKTGEVKGVSDKGKKAKSESEKHREPIREFARQKALEYCKAQKTRPSRAQCAAAILEDVRQKAKNIAAEVEAKNDQDNPRKPWKPVGDDYQVTRTIGDWLKKLPDANKLFDSKARKRT